MRRRKSRTSTRPSRCPSTSTVPERRVVVERRHAQQCRLAAPVGPEHQPSLARHDAHRDVIDQHRSPAAHADAVDLEDGREHPRTGSTRQRSVTCSSRFRHRRFRVPARDPPPDLRLRAAMTVVMVSWRRSCRAPARRRAPSRDRIKRPPSGRPKRSKPLSCAEANAAAAEYFEAQSQFEVLTDQAAASRGRPSRSWLATADRSPEDAGRSCRRPDPFVPAAARASRC